MTEISTISDKLEEVIPSRFRMKNIAKQLYISDPAIALKDKEFGWQLTPEFHQSSNTPTKKELAEPTFGSSTIPTLFLFNANKYIILTREYKAATPLKRTLALRGIKIR